MASTEFEYPSYCFVFRELNRAINYEPNERAEYVSLDKAEGQFIVQLSVFEVESYFDYCAYKAFDGFLFLNYLHKSLSISVSQ